MAKIPEPDGHTLRFLEKAASTKNQPVKTGDILVRKMKTFIMRMDMDNDGYITRRDFELLAERYAEIANLEPARAKQGFQQLIVAWDSVFKPEEVNGKLDGELMAQSLIRRGRDMVVALAAICFSFIFDMLDNKKAGVINKQQFRLYHVMLNVKDGKITDESFRIMDENKDGKLSFLEFIQAGIDYFLTSDINSPYNFLYGPLLE